MLAAAHGPSAIGTTHPVQLDSAWLSDGGSRIGARAPGSSVSSHDSRFLRINGLAIPRYR